jgi:hypothetical protein
MPPQTRETSKRQAKAAKATAKTTSKKAPKNPKPRPRKEKSGETVLETVIVEETISSEGGTRQLRRRPAPIPFGLEEIPDNDVPPSPKRTQTVTSQAAQQPPAPNSIVSESEDPILQELLLREAELQQALRRKEAKDRITLLNDKLYGSTQLERARQRAIDSVESLQKQLDNAGSECSEQVMVNTAEQSSSNSVHNENSNNLKSNLNMFASSALVNGQQQAQDTLDKPRERHSSAPISGDVDQNGTSASTHGGGPQVVQQGCSATCRGNIQLSLPNTAGYGGDTARYPATGSGGGHTLCPQKSRYSNNCGRVVQQPSNVQQLRTMPGVERAAQGNAEWSVFFCVT